MTLKEFLDKLAHDIEEQAPRIPLFSFERNGRKYILEAYTVAQQNLNDQANVRRLH
jgi:hypothetical protein